ncbi:MAG: DUF1080 domain-containing protein [Draconibacterium sp.]|nr:DUF1080 domain-containing protein [Draconibacterium sp.]
MKKIKLLLIAVFSVVFLFSNAQDSQKDFFGMWTLEIEGGSVGWLGVNDDEGFLDAELLWKGGSVTPVSHVYFLNENTLVVTRTREVKRGEEREHVVSQTFRFKRDGDKLEGFAIFPKGDGMGINKEKFKGWRLPDVGEAPDLSKVKYGKPIKLFNGKDLEGWELMGKRKNGFKVVDGVMINDPQGRGYGNLRTVDVFEDFKLTLDVNVPAKSNSGVYLRGMYEIQVLDSYGKELDSHNMGGLYSRVTPTEAAEKPAGEWQTMEMILCKRHITVILNGTTILDNVPAYGPTGGAIIADVFKPGPIYLQGDHGKVSYRNIVLTPIVN